MQTLEQVCPIILYYSSVAGKLPEPHILETVILFACTLTDHLDEANIICAKEEKFDLENDIKQEIEIKVCLKMFF